MHDGRVMIVFFEELLARFDGLERSELAHWIENRWVLPEPHDETWVFHEVDIARVELILDMRRDLALDDEAMPLVLSLLDQIYGLRRQMRRLSDAIECQPAAIREAIRQALPKAGEGG
jgi:chaperone modulatory protein CbpM